MDFCNYTVMKDILRVTCSILRENFFYDNESLGNFIDEFTKEVSAELAFFQEYANAEMLGRLETDATARLHFTCYFVSAHLRDIFIEKLHFSEPELYAFESLLPKYTGERKYETYSKHQGANHRKFFK